MGAVRPAETADGRESDPDAAQRAANALGIHQQSGGAARQHDVRMRDDSLMKAFVCHHKVDSCD